MMKAVWCGVLTAAAVLACSGQAYAQAASDTASERIFSYSAVADETTSGMSARSRFGIDSTLGEPPPPAEGFSSQELVGEPKYLHIDALPTVSA